MSEDNWDKDYNKDNISAVDLASVELQEAIREEEQRRILNGEFVLPFLPDEFLRENFITHNSTSENTYYTTPHTGLYTANRAIWICHDCGCFGYKNTFREKFRCNYHRCRSRNVTICRAGDISMLIRTLQRPAQPGVNMQDIWNARRERMRLARRRR